MKSALKKARRYRKKLDRSIETLKRKAFTLIELLIVIALLGILAAAVLVAVNPGKRTKQARDSIRKSDIGQLATALQTYYTTTGSYPTSLDDLVTNGDIKKLPTPPNPDSGAAGYNYGYTPGGCSPGGNPCVNVTLFETLEAPNNPATDQWCFRSSQGTATELASCIF